MPAENNITILKADKNAKLSRVFFDNLPCAHSVFYSLLKQKDIKINGKRTSTDTAVAAGDVIEIFCAKDRLSASKEAEFEIVYQDNNLVVINKPAGIEVDVENKPCVKIMLEKQLGERLFAVHRLDRNTCGLLMFAKTEAAFVELKRMTKAEEIEKTYRAWVVGVPNFSEKTFTDYLYKDAKRAQVFITHEPKKGSVNIKTSVKLIKTDGEKSLVEVVIHNGKTHQIRAHLAFLGYPIIGDGKYGNDKINKKFKEKTQQLCAIKLQFNSPKTSIFAYLKNRKIELKNQKYC